VRTAARRYVPLTFALIAAALGCQAAPLEIYGRLPRLENMAVSPDGSRIVFVKTEGNERTVAVLDRGKHEVIGGVRASQTKLRRIEWADNDRVMIETSVTTVPRGLIGDIGEWFQLQVYDIRSGRLFQIPETDAFDRVDVMNAIDGHVMVRRLKDRTVLFIPGLQVTDTVDPALIRVDLDTRASHVVRPGKLGNLGWLIDDTGEIAAEETYNEENGRWSIFIRQEGHMREAASGHDPIDFPRLLGWGPAADTLLLQRLENGNSVWRLLSLKDGSIGAPLAEKKSLAWPIEDTRTNRMIGGVHIEDGEEYLFFDPGVQNSWQAILAALPGERVQFESASADFRKMIVRVEGERHGYAYMFVDLDAHRVNSLGDIYEGVKQPFEVRRVTYSAGDGLPIPAYLTLPRGKPPRNLPLVVLPHGCPQSRNTADFDWWPQALADQGYAVLQPNFRGSSLSWEFVTRGFGEWGRKMQTDLSDGVRYLAKEGIADPGRVCIMGASYGGYAALAGPTLDPGVYRCAVAVAGIGDHTRMLKWVNARERSRSNSAQRYWDRFMGISGPNDPAVEAISPVRHIAAVSVPILLIHGKDDTVVPYEQSQVMYDALRGAHKDVELVTLKKEDHWLSSGDTRLQMLEASVAFLRKHNPPD
jgi:dipeptidyl aminopeptidase/acylaminoacyl peptidase